MKKGQALLVAILVIFVAAIALGLAAASVALVQSQSSANQRLRDQTYNLASAGIDEGLMRVSRGQTSFPDLELKEGTSSCKINISVVNVNSYRVLATAEGSAPLLGNKKVTKKIQADVSIQNGVTTLTSYKEVD